MDRNLIKLAETEHSIIFGTTDGGMMLMAKECWEDMIVPGAILAPDWRLIKIPTGVTSWRLPDMRRAAKLVTIEMRKAVIDGHILRCNFDLAMKVWIVAGNPVKIS
jgi:hypothetical protein